MAGGIVRSTFIPFNNIATYASPSGPPTPSVAGNLIDPVAQKMMSYFPEPNVTGGEHLNRTGSGLVQATAPTSSSISRSTIASHRTI